MKTARLSACFSHAIGALLLLSGHVHADTVYVTDGEFSDNGAIRTFDSSGNRSTFATGLDIGPLAFDISGNLYMANYYAGTIEKFNSSGQGTVFASSGVNNAQALAFDSQGNLYAANYGNGTIEKFNSAGQGSVFASGLYGPCGLAFDSSGNLYVADTGGQIGAYTVGNNIMEFAPNGSGSVFAANVWPAMGGNLAIDSSGNLYLADSLSVGTILKFDSSGNSTVFASLLAGPEGQAPVPRGLAFDSSGNLYMASNGSVNGYGVIDKFDSAGNESVFGYATYAAFIAAQQEVPEPSTWTMLALGGGAFLGSRRLHRRAVAGAPAPTRHRGPIGTARATNKLAGPLAPSGISLAILLTVSIFAANFDARADALTLSAAAGPQAGASQSYSVPTNVTAQICYAFCPVQNSGLYSSWITVAVTGTPSPGAYYPGINQTGTVSNLPTVVGPATITLWVTNNAYSGNTPTCFCTISNNIIRQALPPVRQSSFPTTAAAP